MGYFGVEYFNIDGSRHFKFIPNLYVFVNVYAQFVTIRLEMELVYHLKNCKKSTDKYKISLV